MSKRRDYVLTDRYGNPVMDNLTKKEYETYLETLAELGGKEELKLEAAMQEAQVLYLESKLREQERHAAWQSNLHILERLALQSEIRAIQDRAAYQEHKGEMWAWEMSRRVQTESQDRYFRHLLQDIRQHYEQFDSDPFEDV